MLKMRMAFERWTLNDAEDEDGFERWMLNDAEDENGFER